MRVLVHDYSGHPFQVQLTRSLAARGHTARHAYCAGIQTPRGKLDRQPNDAREFNIGGLGRTRDLAKYKLATRAAQELEYAAIFAAEIRRSRPDVVLSSNTPPHVQWAGLLAACSIGARYFVWLQDVYSRALPGILESKLGPRAAPLARPYEELEYATLRYSDGLVLITEDFHTVADAARVPRERRWVIPNWADMDDISPRPRANAWSREHRCAERTNFVYSGTLGLKHDPEALLSLARHVADRGADVIVVSEGIGADHIRARVAELGLTNVKQFPFQPFSSLPDVLGAGDVLVALLEPDAGKFSVPSKVLSYLCAERALLLSVPAENLAAKTVETAHAGICVAPGDSAGLLRAADKLLDDVSSRATMAHNGRAYAEQHFDIDRITDQFEALLR